jgi:hypothetical protein
MVVSYSITSKRFVFHRKYTSLCGSSDASGFGAHIYYIYILLFQLCTAGCSGTESRNGNEEQAVQKAREKRGFAVYGSVKAGW